MNWRGAAIALTLVSVALTLIAGADALGLTARQLAWLGIAQGVIAVGLGFLPPVHRNEGP